MTWQTHLINNAVVLVLLATLDHLIIKPFVQARLGRVKADGEKKPERRQAESARWFFVHSLANVGVVATSVVSMQCVLLDPLHAMDGTVHTDRSFFGAASAWPLTIINSVHVYHLIGGFKLNAGERFHHFVFIPTLGFPGQAFCWGALSNWQAFFISGVGSKRLERIAGTLRWARLRTAPSAVCARLAERPRPLSSSRARSTMACLASKRSGCSTR